METCEVRYEYPDDSYPVVIKYCVNKKIDKTQKDISEHDIETNLNATKMMIEKYPDGHDDEKKRENRKGEIHRVIYAKVTEIHQYALYNVTFEIPDDTNPTEMKKFVNNEEDGKKEITAQNEDEGVIQKVSTEYEKETNWDTLYKVI